MGRMPRIHIEGGLYLITTRGDHGEELFKDDIDRSQYLELLSKYKEQYSFKLFSYVLMPTFVHLLIELAPGTTISEIMHVLNSTYTKYFNSRYNRRGHLFQGRFKSSLVEKTTYLTELTRYIHLVPVIGRLAGRPEGYRWSSYPIYIGKEKDLVGMEGDTKEVLNSFSTNTDKHVRLYESFMESVAIDKLDQLRKRLQASWILGSKVFIEGVKSKLKEDEEKEQEEKKRAWVESRPHKVFLVAGGITILILAIVTLYLYRANMGLVTMFERALEKKETEFIEKLRSEKDVLRRDLDEKYRADKVSYKAMQKRLEIEKEKAKEMEEEIEELKEGKRGKKR